MIDHVTLHVSDFETSKNFYKIALAPLGYTVLMDMSDHHVAGFGQNGAPDFWIAQKEPVGNQHVAISAESREIVDKFHSAGLVGGGTDNGAPGLRKNYGPHYYAAFIIDFDGNNIEVVCNREV
jgi:predicted lactoylglutathione lyase